ncbi:unnamed protein product [Amoebophrya sp. A120]|nr:unnamed protein product [Amoebophrya sp. A120]|eukprot:GSA120T00009817001.1
MFQPAGLKTLRLIQRKKQPVGSCNTTGIKTANGTAATSHVDTAARADTASTTDSGGTCEGHGREQVLSARTATSSTREQIGDSYEDESNSTAGGWASSSAAGDHGPADVAQQSYHQTTSTAHASFHSFEQNFEIIEPKPFLFDDDHSDQESEHGNKLLSSRSCDAESDESRNIPLDQQGRALLHHQPFSWSYDQDTNLERVLFGESRKIITRSSTTPRTSRAALVEHETENKRPPARCGDNHEATSSSSSTTEVGEGGVTVEDLCSTSTSSVEGGCRSTSTRPGTSSSSRTIKESRTTGGSEGGVLLHDPARYKSRAVREEVLETSTISRPCEDAFASLRAGGLVDFCGNGTARGRETSSSSGTAAANIIPDVLWKVTSADDDVGVSSSPTSTSPSAGKKTGDQEELHGAFSLSPSSSRPAEVVGDAQATRGTTTTATGSDPDRRVKTTNPVDLFASFYLEEGTTTDEGAAQELHQPLLDDLDNAIRDVREFRREMQQQKMMRVPLHAARIFTGTTPRMNANEHERNLVEQEEAQSPPSSLDEETKELLAQADAVREKFGLHELKSITHGTKGKGPADEESDPQNKRSQTPPSPGSPLSSSRNQRSEKTTMLTKVVRPDLKLNLDFLADDDLLSTHEEMSKMTQHTTRTTGTARIYDQGGGGNLESLEACLHDLEKFLQE